MRSVIRRHARLLHVGGATVIAAGVVTTLLAGCVRQPTSSPAAATSSPVTSPVTSPVASSVASSAAEPTTPIQHVVVLFQENVPFDRYFGVYPHAMNPPGEPAFTPRAGTPTVNGLTQALLTHNPNLAQPHRLDRTQHNVCGSNHGYLREQKAEDHGRVDRFVQETGDHLAGCDPTLGLDYFDGNTVTALWNYAQNYALNDNSFGTTYGPSHIGLLNLVSGQTHGAVTNVPTTSVVAGTMIANVEPTFDDCPRAALHATMTGRNIGDLLNARHVSWGFFSDGFRPTSRRADGTAVCSRKASNRYGFSTTVYDSGDEGFQYYRSTSNPHHLPPSSVAAIGHTDQANHQYDLADFWAAADHENLPAVSFLKAGGFEQGGGGASDALDEQNVVVDLINHLQRLPSWSDTAVIIMYDDSDGSYDHVMPPLVNTSQTRYDALTGVGRCGNAAPALAGYQGRCGHGPRLPFLVISPWSRANYVDRTMTDQTSVIRFVEDNWGLGRIGDGSFDALSGPITNMFDFSHRSAATPLVLDRETGQPVTGASTSGP